MNTNYHIIVDAQGQGDVATIQQALNLAPNDNSPFRILIRRGCYEEKLHITRPNTHLVGASKNNTVIRYTAANGLLASDGKIWATYNSYVVNADATDVTFQNLTIENSFDFMANQRKEPQDPSKVTATQAVALLIGQNGSQVQCKDCTLKSYQDTLYVSAGTSYFESVDIWGTVDFIFGGGTALFNHCRLVSRYREDVNDDSPWGYIAAPSTLIDQEYGLMFYRCQLVKENSYVPANSYKLGRPWHPTTQFDDGAYANPDAIGHCIYIECDVEDHISGWDKMHGKARNGQTQHFYAEDSRFYTFRNRYQSQVYLNHSHFELAALPSQLLELTTIFADWNPCLLSSPIPPIANSHSKALTNC